VDRDLAANDPLLALDVGNESLAGSVPELRDDDRPEDTKDDDDDEDLDQGEGVAHSLV
jgi:hypothetical protein